MNPNLVKVNGKVLSKQEKHLVLLLDRPIMRMALQQGWMLSTAPNNTAGMYEAFVKKLNASVHVYVC